MGILNISPVAVVGDDTTGVQAMFPRFRFDLNSLPSLAQVTRYADTAIVRLSRIVRVKGYDPADIISDEHLRYLSSIAELMVASEVHVTLDQNKDRLAANPRLTQLNSALAELDANPEPFPDVLRRYPVGGEEGAVPTRLVRNFSQPSPWVTTSVLFRYNEIPTGEVDGVNTVFRLWAVPEPSSSLILSLDGVLVSPSSFTVSLSTVIFSVAPASGAALVAVSYAYKG